MKTIVWNQASPRQKAAALARPAQSDDPQKRDAVAAIVTDVKKRGDTALHELSRRFDKSTRKNFRVSEKEIDDAVTTLDPKLKASIKRAKAAIEKFHKAQLPKPVTVETLPGVTCSLVWRPIETVGLYIPAGTAPLFSSLLMEALPARIAGCQKIFLCSPPQKDGSVDPVILTTSKLCGIRDVFALGGAQAIAAMAFGTQTVPKVDKIFGPGNAYVTLAKQLVAQDPNGAAIDMPAGPSEVLVLADKSARPDWVAADLLSQAEHDPSSQALLVTTCPILAQNVKKEVARQVTSRPRQAIAHQSLAQSRIIVVPTLATALDVLNAYAPEHAILHTPKAATLLPKIRHAGSVFLGPQTPESAGDYASGTNHVLPTAGYARAYSGLSIYSFMKTMTAQSLTTEGLRRLGPDIVRMAVAEGLDAHARAVTIRTGETP